MAANFRFIAHAAERYTHELAPRRVADGHRQRSLPDARRPHKTQNRALRILDQLADGKEFQDAVLDLLEPVMLFVQNLFRGFDIANFLGPLLPGHREQPIQVVAADGRFRGHRRHQFQALQLLDGLFMDFLGHPRRINFLLQLVDFAFFAAPQLFLDGFELFVQVILFLRAFHLPFHTRIDVAVDVQLFELDLQNVADAVQPFQRINRFQQILLFIHRQLQVGGDGVREPRWIIHARGRNHRVVVQALRKLNELLVKPGHFFDDLLDLRRILYACAEQPNRRAEEALFRGNRDGPRPFHAFDQNFDVAVRELHALHDVRERSYRVNLLRFGVIHGSVMLRGKEDLLVAGQRLFERAHTGFAADNEGRHLLRKDDHVAHRHHRHAPHLLFFSCKHAGP